MEYLMHWQNYFIYENLTKPLIQSVRHCNIINQASMYYTVLRVMPANELCNNQLVHIHR